MKNFIIGYGETLTDVVTVKNGSGDKKHPYSIIYGRKRLASNLAKIITDIDSKSEDTCANNEVVVQFIQHPSYLAKTYYPRKMFKKFGMKDIGSKSLSISPEKWGISKPPASGLTSCIYVSGTKNQYKNMLENLKNGVIEDNILELIRTIERVELLDAKEKIKHLDIKPKVNRLEVVIHASSEDKEIISSFRKYVNKIGGIYEVEKEKM